MPFVKRRRRRSTNRVRPGSLDDSRMKRVRDCIAFLSAAYLYIGQALF